LRLYDELAPAKCRPGFPVVVYSGKNAGMTGTVVDVDDSCATVQIAEVRAPQIGDVMACEAVGGSAWLSLDKIAGFFGLRWDVLLPLLSSCPATNPIRDITFTLCPPGFVLDGWCRRLSSGFFFFYELTDLLDGFFKSAENLLPYLQRRGSRPLEQYPLTGSDCFPVHPARRIDKFIQAMQDTRPFSSALLIDDDWVTMSHAGVREIEAIVERWGQTRTRRTVLEIPFENLIWPGKPLPAPQVVRLGSRVVVIAASGQAPFGTFATVVGGSGHRGELELLTDEENPRFSYLRHKLTTRRGLTLKKGDVFRL
jgi:hypothetical protein